MNFQKEIGKMADRAMEAYTNATLTSRTNENRLSAVGNIYFIFSGNELKYIGQRQAKGIKTRLD